MGSIASLKRTVVEALLEKEDFFLLVVDPKQQGVVLPEYLLESGQPVGINIGRKMAIPIPDLDVDENGIQGTLSFSRTPFYCFFPWPCVVQLSAHEEHLVWVLPQEEQTDKPQDQRPKLRLV
jgi:hypothetical protein